MLHLKQSTESHCRTKTWGYIPFSKYSVQVNFEIVYRTLGIHHLRFDVFYLCCLYFKSNLINLFVQFQPIVSYCIVVDITQKTMLWVNYSCIFNLISNMWCCNIVKCVSSDIREHFVGMELYFSFFLILDAKEFILYL